MTGVTIPDDLPFAGWPKIARLNREIVITEKIDGTNSAVIIREDGRIHAQSRNRFIAPGQDNHGFAAWVQKEEEFLKDTLGVGTHYGEWWGQGIARKYKMDHKVFSVFNTHRWGAILEENEEARSHGLDVVPVLYQGLFSTDAIDQALWDLEDYGSQATPPYDIDFMDPEGVVIFHTAANEMFKITLKNDEAPKSQVKVA